MPKVYIAGDHAGFALKALLVPYIEGLGHVVEDCGAFSLESGDDYPDYITPCATKVAGDVGSVGIIIGASGQGEAMVANRVHGVRAGVYYGEPAGMQTDMAGNELSMIQSMRRHNHATILSLGARFLSEEQAQKAIQSFLETPFDEDERHVRRVAKF